MMFRRRERKSRSSSAEAERVLATFLILLGKLTPLPRSKAKAPRAATPEVI